MARVEIEKRISVDIPDYFKYSLDTEEYIVSAINSDDVSDDKKVNSDFESPFLSSRYFYVERNYTVRESESNESFSDEKLKEEFLMMIFIGDIIDDPGEILCEDDLMIRKLVIDKPEIMVGYEVYPEEYAVPIDFFVATPSCFYKGSMYFEDIEDFKECLAESEKILQTVELNNE